MRNRFNEMIQDGHPPVSVLWDGDWCHQQPRTSWEGDFEKLHSAGYLKKIVQHLKLKSLETISHAYDRVLFVDCDILFYDEILVDKVDLEGFPIGATYDIAVSSGITSPDFLQNCRHNNRSPHYFNSGFMLFDSTRWDGNSREKIY